MLYLGIDSSLSLQAILLPIILKDTQRPSFIFCILEVPEIHTVQVDLRDWKQTRDEIEKLEAIDLLVNNAGVCKMNDFLTASQDELNE